MREKSARVNLRVTPEQERDWKAAAALSGKTLTDWLSDMADLEATRVSRRLTRGEMRGEGAASAAPRFS